MHSRACHSDGRISAKSRCHRYRHRLTTAIHRDKASQSSRVVSAIGWQIGGRPTWQLTPIGPFYSDKSHRYIKVSARLAALDRHPCYFCIVSNWFRAFLSWRFVISVCNGTSHQNGPRRDSIRELFTYIFISLLVGDLQKQELYVKVESKRWK